MKTVVITHDGFHGMTTVRVQVPDNAQPGERVVVSPRVARRINRACCPGGGCRCGEQLAFQEMYQWWVGPNWYITLPTPGHYRLGNYPQAR